MATPTPEELEGVPPKGRVFLLVRIMDRYDTYYGYEQRSKDVGKTAASTCMRCWRERARDKEVRVACRAPYIT